MTTTLSGLAFTIPSTSSRLRARPVGALGLAITMVWFRP